MSLKDIYCQDRAIEILQKAHSAGRAAHAYIFAGIEGVGRYKTAREWAKMLLCQSVTVENSFSDSCGLCESCRLLEAGSHPDFHPVYKELIEFTKAKQGRKTPVDLPIDVIREFLIEKVSAKPTLSKRKVFIINEAEKLNMSSQNALLKVLEEPPEYCCILLLCTRLEQLLPTTKSRCQIIRFGPVDIKKIVEELKEMGLEETQARYFSGLAEGSVGRAGEWAGLQLEGAQLYQSKKKLLDTLASYNYSQTLEFAAWLLSECRRISSSWAELDKDTSKKDLNRRSQKTFIRVIISALRDVMETHLRDSGKLINFDQQNSIHQLSCQFSAEQSAEKIVDCYRAMHQIDSNVNEKLVFEQLLLSLAEFDTMKV